MASEDYNNHRWSEVIPPHTALTFAAVWDPDEGMVTFSGGHLLESDVSECGNSSPKEAYDSQSQVLTIDRIAWALNSGERPARPVGIIELNDLISEDSGSFYTSEPGEGGGTIIRRPQTHFLTVGRRLLSAALTPLDGRIFRPISRKDEEPLTEKDKTEDDSAFFEDACMTATARSFGSVPVLVNLNLKSSFSVSSTSTTNYVHVFPPSVLEGPPSPPPPPPKVMLHPQESSLDVWSTLPQQHSYIYPQTKTSSSSSSSYGRLKPRRLQRRNVPLSIIPADPREVLARQQYNHVVTPSSSDGHTLARGLKKQKSLAKIKELVSQLTVRCPYLSRNEGGVEEPLEVREDRGWCWILRTGSVLQL